MQRVGLHCAGPVDLADHRRGLGVGGLGCGGGVTLAGHPQLLDLAGRVGAARFDAGQAQRPLHGDLPVAEGRVGQHAGVWRILEGHKTGDHPRHVLGAQLAVLLAQVLA